jgi:hypothetical protein
VHFATRPDVTTNGAFKASVIGMMGFFGAFWLFNVAFGRTWKWPVLGFVGAFVSMFVTRIAFGR